MSDGLIGDAESSDAAVELLVAKHPEIKVVQIGSDEYTINITDRGLLTLLTADGLTKVSLSGAPLITAESLGLHSNSTQHIQHLALIECSLTDKGLFKILDTCGIQLISLDVSNSCNITGEGFHGSQDKFINMEKLSLRGCRRLTQQGLSEILRMCGSRLQDLDISNSTSITGQRLEELQGKFADLKTLNLQRCYRLADQGLLKVLRMCGTKLQYLDVSWTHGHKGLDELQGKFADIKTLNLANCLMLSDQEFFKVINICGPLLKSVLLYGSNISSEAKSRMQLNRPNLTIEDYEDEDEYEDSDQHDDEHGSEDEGNDYLH